MADTKLPRFDSVMLPHLDAAYNFARWLTRNDQDAQDVSQEAFMRAFEFFDGFKGGDPRPWLLTIVRNTFYTWLRKNRASDVQEFDEELHTSPSELSDPATAALRKHDSATLRQALDGLPGAAREILVLREMEDLAYHDIARILGVPIGTVMSRLARARKRLQEALAKTDVGGHG